MKKDKSLLPTVNERSILDLRTYIGQNEGMEMIFQANDNQMKDFLGSPVVKTSSSNEGSAVQSLVKELRFHMPQSQKT